MSADNLPDELRDCSAEVGGWSIMDIAADKIERQARQIEILERQVNGLTKCDCGEPLGRPACGVCDNDD